MHVGVQVPAPQQCWPAAHVAQYVLYTLQQVKLLLLLVDAVSAASVSGIAESRSVTIVHATSVKRRTDDLHDDIQNADKCFFFLLVCACGDSCT